MSKSKNMIYALALAVLSIWGIIMYRVFLTVAEASEPGNLTSSKAMVSKVALPKLYPDTFSLQLDFPDPFTGKILSVPAKGPDTTVSRAALKPVSDEPPTIAPNPVEQLRYLGYVSDAKGRNKLAIVDYMGTEKMMKEGDTAGPVELIHIGPGAVTVQHKGKKTTIKTQ